MKIMLEFTIVAPEWSGKLQIEALLLQAALGSISNSLGIFHVACTIIHCRDAFTSLLSTCVSQAVRNVLQFTLNHMVEMYLCLFHVSLVQT